jgi:hypothetical protein
LQSSIINEIIYIFQYIKSILKLTTYLPWQRETLILLLCSMIRNMLAVGGVHDATFGPRHILEALLRE